MKNRRIFVEKYSRFQVEAETLRKELNTNLGLNIEHLRYVNVYDLFGFSDELLEKSRYSVFGEVVTDLVTDECDTEGMPSLAVEFLPGQFDQRAASAVDCVHLIEPNAEVKIKSSRLYIFDKSVDEEAMARIEKYLINAVESRKKNLEILSDMESAEVKPVAVLEGFRQMKEEELAPYCKANGLAMNADDLREVVNYFKKEGRDPVETELRILDTYWSDHCRHTTFTTDIEEITLEESFMKAEMEESLELMRKVRRELNRENKSLCLMELATIGARYLKKQGKLDDMEQSEENNACSIFVNVDVDGVMERWLLQFKNETHNHPTEIEPFGGASTCLGGAIRDPLSGRSYVYQAMRVTGAGDIYKPVDQTMEGKL
ncbi:MAG: phosphoribosylformylglycinamidine synthase, partial [Alistipes sp.]|nr:phosphoribosylformylglycinamidine synthase [Alistipes sp.]